MGGLEDDVADAGGVDELDVVPVDVGELVGNARGMGGLVGSNA